jgi:transposase
MRWLSLRVILPPNLSMSFAMLMEYAKDKRKKAGLQLIWNAFMWIIWKVMNDGIYNII